MVNTINWSNVTSFQGILQAGNTASGGTFWTMVSYLLFVIVTLATINWGFEIALFISATISIVVSLPLLYAGLLPNWVIGSFIGTWIVMAFIIFFSSKSDN